MPNERMGLPPRSLAADAHNCIMAPIPAGVGSTEYKHVARDLCCHPWRARLRLSPLYSLLAVIATGYAVPDTAEPAAVLGAVQGVAWRCCASMNDLATAILDRPCARQTMRPRVGTKGCSAGGRTKG